MKMSSNGVEVVKQSGNTFRTKHGETLVAFAVSMDTPLQNSVGLSLVPRVRERGLGTRLCRTPIVHRAADAGREAAKVGWKTDYYFGVFNAVRTLPPYFSHSMSVFDRLPPQFMHRSMRESDAVQTVKAAGETSGAQSGQKSMPTTCGEGALCASTIITKGCTALWGEHESNSDLSRLSSLQATGRVLLKAHAIGLATGKNTSLHARHAGPDWDGDVDLYLW